MRKLRLTEILILINSIVYVILAILSFNAITISSDILIWVAQSNYMIIYHFLYYEFLTSVFVHFNLSHILSNSLFLLIFGYRCEELFSKRDYLIIYFSSGLAGNLLSLLLGINSLSGGSSGAILGIFSSILYAISVKEKRAFKVFLMIGIFFLILIGAQYGVNPISHWIGFIVGLIVGYYLFKKANVNKKNESKTKLFKKKILLKKMN